ncbi:hypothetical protein ACET3Z_004958 [Daucus carota]
MASFCGENESRDCFSACSMSKPFWEGKDEAADVSRAFNLGFSMEDRAAGPVERTTTLDLRLSQQAVVARLIVFVVYIGCVVVVVEVQMKTVELRRSCIPEVRLQMNVFDVEGNDVVIGMVNGVGIGVVLVVEVVAVAAVDFVVVVVVPLETDAVEAEH